MSNTFGSILRLTTFGESHGVSIGGVIDGFPAGFKINFIDFQQKLKSLHNKGILLAICSKNTDKIA